MNENCLEDGRKINIEEIKEAGRRHAKTLRRRVHCVPFGIVVCESMQGNVRLSKIKSGFLTLNVKLLDIFMP